MAGWTHQKRLAVEQAFYAYLSRCVIDSKEDGEIVLGEHLYASQRTAITMVFDGLEQDIHDFFILKSRQLGLSTITRALTVFFLGLHKGLKGALVFDTSEHKEDAREELVNMIRALPESLKFPSIKKDNRAGLTLENNSKILFMSAGVRQSVTSGTLGRSAGLSLAHCSEMCSWSNAEGLEAFKNALAQTNPNRLYIWESTARGFNQWFDMWKEARKDTEHCKCIFLGWWSHDAQRIEHADKDWALYGDHIAPSPEEIRKIQQVKELYGVDITPEQLAWVRKKYDPTARAEGDTDPTFEANTTRIQEQPWLEEEAFQQTGAIFFGSEKLTDQTNKHASKKFHGYMFLTGQEFVDMRVLKAENTKSLELKVWEDPAEDAEYVIGVDPAYGENEHNDRSSIQVLRCYADGIDQVAEYNFTMINTRQLAWVVAALLGWYSKGTSRVRYILELNGPGTAVFNELRSLRHQIDNGYPPLEESGLKNIFRNVSQYIYSRPDSMGAGYNLHFKTTTHLKVTIMERLRDFVSNGMFHIRSFELLDEMKTIARDGDSIKADGSTKHDDRVLAAAFAVHCWEEKSRKQLVIQKRTREAEAARKRLSITDQVFLFNQNTLEMHFRQKSSVRQMEQRLAVRQAWRGRR